MLDTKGERLQCMLLINVSASSAVLAVKAKELCTRYCCLRVFVLLVSSRGTLLTCKCLCCSCCCCLRVSTMLFSRGILLT